MDGQKAGLNALLGAERTNRHRGVLGASFMVAVSLHAALLFGFTPKQPTDIPVIRGGQGIEVDILSFPASGSVMHEEAQADPVQHWESVQDPSVAEAPQEPPPVVEVADMEMPVPLIPPSPPPVASVSPSPQRQSALLPPARAVSQASSSAAGATVPGLTPAPLADKTGDRAEPGSETRNPKPVHNPKPVYPPLARQRGQEGETLLRVSVDATGQVGAVAVERSSGFSLLDDAAVKGVQRWRFQPAMRNGVAVAGEVMLPVIFYLQ